MKSLKCLLLASLLFSCLSTVVSAQQLPDLPTKPTPKFENPSFCPPEGNVASHGDPELNQNKNRIDSPSQFFPVGSSEIQTLPFPQSAGGKLESDWTASERKAIEKSEGIPITVEGFLAIVNNAHQGEPPLMQGARPEGKESCNCNSIKPKEIDFHLWLLPAAADSRKKAIVVEMTPRVRKNHPGWTVAKLTTIAKNKTPVRVSGWLMFDGQHPEQIMKTRATLWEIHPIIQVQFKQGNTWKTL
jgi:hypothetical protein